MPNEQAYVQVAVDGSGKKVANVSVTEPQAVDASGNAQADLVRYQQLITLIDERGFLIDHKATAEMVVELRAIHAALDQLVMLLS